MSFAKFSRISSHRTDLEDCIFNRAPLRNCLFHAQVAGFQPQDTIRSISQVFFNYFIQEQEVEDVHLLKIPENYM